MSFAGTFHALGVEAMLTSAMTSPTWPLPVRMTFGNHDRRDVFKDVS